MIKTVLKVEGMACSMCEAHLNEAVRKAFTVKKVSASHTKGRMEILSEEPLDTDRLKTVICDTGYTVSDVHAEPYEKKSFSLFHR